MSFQAAASSPQAVDPGARTGRRLRAAAVVALLAVLAGLVLVRGRDRFEGRVVSHEGKAAHVVYQREPFTLQFTDRRNAGTSYQVLYSQGDAARFFQGRTGAKGHTSKIVVARFEVGGRVSVRWVVDGKVKARWAFVVRAPRKRSGA